MEKRYQIGFDEGIGCVLVDDNPTMLAVVDMGGRFGNGELVALCPCKYTAERIVNALNMSDVIEKTWTSVP